MLESSVMVQPVRGGELRPDHRRTSVRRTASLEATSQMMDEVESISWGAVVHDMSAGGVGITLCYPFRPGTYLAVDLPRPAGQFRTVLVRVVHVSDGTDGAWYLGCEFVTPMTDSAIDIMI